MEEFKSKRPKVAVCLASLLAMKDIRHSILDWFSLQETRKLKHVSKAVKRGVLPYLYSKTKKLGIAANVFHYFSNPSYAVSFTPAQKPATTRSWSADRFVIMIISPEKKLTRVIGKFREARVSKRDYMIISLPFDNRSPDAYVDLPRWEKYLKTGNVVGVANISVILQKAISRGDDIFYLYFPRWLQIYTPDLTRELSSELYEPDPDFSIVSFRLGYHYLVYHYFDIFLLEPPKSNFPGALARNIKHTGSLVDWETEIKGNMRKRTTFGKPQRGFPTLSIASSQVFNARFELGSCTEGDSIPLRNKFAGFYVTGVIVNAL